MEQYLESDDSKNVWTACPKCRTACKVEVIVLWSNPFNCYRGTCGFCGTVFCGSIYDEQQKK